jgi:hypothetical protein
MQTVSPRNRTFWATPALSLGMGVVLLGAAWAGGQPGLGVTMLAVMAGFAVLLVVVSRRSETVQGLLDRRDERLAGIDLAATAAAGSAVIAADLVAFAVDLARGGDGMPYAWLGAVGGLAYAVAVVALRLRR